MGGPRFKASRASRPSDCVLVTAAHDRTIRFWNPQSQNEIHRITNFNSQINRLVISPDGKFLAAACFTDIAVYNISVRPCEKEPMCVLSAHSANVTGLGFGRNEAGESSYLVSSSEDGTVKLWNPADETLAGDLKHTDRENPHQLSPVNDVAILPGQDEVVACDAHGAVRIWNLMSKECTTYLRPQGEDLIGERWNGSGRCSALAVSTCGLLAVACGSGFHTRVTVLPGTEDPFRGLIYLYNLTETPTGSVPTLLTTIKAHDNHILRLTFSPHNNALASTSCDGSAKIFKIVSGLFEQLITHAQIEGGEPRTDIKLRLRFFIQPVVTGRWVWDCCFSADGTFLVTAGSDHSVKLWDVAELDDGGLLPVARVTTVPGNLLPGQVASEVIGSTAESHTAAGSTSITTPENENAIAESDDDADDETILASINQGTATASTSADAGAIAGAGPGPDDAMNPSTSTAEGAQSGASDAMNQPTSPAEGAQSGQRVFPPAVESGTLMAEYKGHTKIVTCVALYDGYPGESWY